MQLTRFLDVALSSAAKVKILRHLVLDSKPKSGRALAREVEVSAAQVRLVLQELHGDGLVYLERVGRSHVYSLRNETFPVRELLIPLFKKERGLSYEVACQVAAATRTPTLSICLFGSVAKGSDHAESDLDLAFVVQGTVEERALREELAGEVADKAASLGVMLGPYVITRSELRRRHRERDHFIRELVNTAQCVSGYHLMEVILRGFKKGQDSKR